MIYRYDRTAYYKIVDLVQTLVAKDVSNVGNEVKDETPVDEPCSTLYVGQNASGMATVNVTFAWDVSLTNASLRWSFTRTNGTAATEWINGIGVFTASTITAVWTNVANAAREFNLWTWYDMPTNQMGPGPLRPNGIRDPLEPYRMVKVVVIGCELIYAQGSNMGQRLPYVPVFVACDGQGRGSSPPGVLTPLFVAEFTGTFEEVKNDSPSTGHYECH